MSNIVEGTVKWFNEDKGFGFISQASGSDVFAHYTSIKGSGHRSLNEGQSVEFVITMGAKGPQAEEIVAL
ncbi:MAG: cold-shock protein [Lentisphaerales bacterium]|nr:cold-shock protein [Lentisphaerales bacterium]